MSQIFNSISWLDFLNIEDLKEKQVYYITDKDIYAKIKSINNKIIPVYYSNAVISSCVEESDLASMKEQLNIGLFVAKKNDNINLYYFDGTSLQLISGISGGEPVQSPVTSVNGVKPDSVGDITLYANNIKGLLDGILVDLQYIINNVALQNRTYKNLTAGKVINPLQIKICESTVTYDGSNKATVDLTNLQSGIQVYVNNEKVDFLYFTSDPQTQLNNKVDKVQGKNLSTNDYTNEAKNKVESAILFTPMNLTEEQKRIARENIGSGTGNSNGGLFKMAIENGHLIMYYDEKIQPPNFEIPIDGQYKGHLIYKFEK